MGDHKDKAKKDYVSTPSLKRSDSHLTPPKLDEKKTKMADQEAEIVPKLVEKLAQKDDLDKLLDNSKTTIFEPCKSQILDRMDTLETKVDDFPGKLDKIETYRKISNRTPLLI